MGLGEEEKRGRGGAEAKRNAGRGVERDVAREHARPVGRGVRGWATNGRKETPRAMEKVVGEVLGARLYEVEGQERC